MTNPGLREPLVSVDMIQFRNMENANMHGANVSGGMFWSGGKLYVANAYGIMTLVTSA